MQHGRFVFSSEPVPPVPAGTKDHNTGFVTCPAFLWAGLTWDQVMWRQWVYQRAWAQAQVSFPGLCRFTARVAEMPRAWRN